LDVEATCSASHFVGHAEMVSSPLFEITRVLVRLNHVASFIVNANHTIMGESPPFSHRKGSHLYIDK
jgi:hypothetical protein